MSSFIRPEAKASLFRWREVLVGSVVVLLGINWALRAAGPLQWMGPVVCVAGLALVWLGWQRGRFRSADGGTGAVEVDEGQVTYLGPLDGGTVSLREMNRLIFDGGQYPAHWQLEQRGQAPLMIPVNAAGSDALFDAFASLPGLRTDRMLAELETNTAHAVVIWQRNAMDREAVGRTLH